MTVYALIDSAQRPGFHQRLQRLGVQYLSLFEGHPERNLPEIAPLLLVLPNGDREDEQTARDMIDKLAAEKPSVSHIQSDLELPDLAVHLRGFHLAKIPGRREMIVRWYDTRVLPAWLEVLEPQQRATFLSGIQGWRYFDRFGDGNDVRCDVGDPVSELAPKPFVLKGYQYEALMQAAEVDALMVRLQGVVRDELSRVDPRSLYNFVEAQLQSARGHGLTSMSDYIQYVLMALFTSGRFVEHPHIAARLENKFSEEQPFAEWTQTVPQDVFEAGNPLWKEPA